MISCRDYSSLAIASRLFVGGNVQVAQWPDMGRLNMDTNYIIETKNLTKQYGSQKSVAENPCRNRALTL